MKRRFLPCVISLFWGFNLCAGFDSEAVRKHMLSDLDFIKHNFEVQYAPFEWKKEFVAWNLDQIFNDARFAVNNLSKPTTKDCQIILKKIFQETKDYHVAISFLSTEYATLPFLGMSVENRYYIVSVDRSGDNPPLNEGDEILNVNGIPIMEALNKFRREEIGDNTIETDRMLAEMFFTTRLGSRGHKIPRGEVVLTLSRKGTRKIETVKLVWNYREEAIIPPGKKFPAISAHIDLENKSQKETIKSFFNKMMISPGCFQEKNFFARNNYWIGARQSFIPRMGKVMWQTKEDEIFDAYIFKINDPQMLPQGKKELHIGYIRIPHYGSDEKEAAAFQKLIDFMNYKTDALIIDQINNPGGSVFYMYALASMLTNKPLEAPRHRIALTQKEIAIACMMLEALDEVPKGDDHKAKELFGNNLAGYEVNFHFVEACQMFCHHLISEWKEGALFTAPIHLYGVDKIQPHSKDRYTKPILLLINSLDFSGGDFFPAILQDNKRAKLLGTRTAGAGGYVNTTTFSNLTGIHFFSSTGSLAIRQNKEPLENLGVTPDIYYSLTKNDIENNYHSYTQKILESICHLLK